MKLSEETLKILKNFSGINPSIFIRSGSFLSTQSISGNLLAEAHIEDEFPCEFALYDLQEFLNTLKLFSSPILDFRDAKEKVLYICEEDNINFRVKYAFAKKEHIEYPRRKAQMGNIDISFDLDKYTLNSIIKSSNIMQLPNMIILPGKNDTVNLIVSDVKSPKANKLSVDIKAEKPSDLDFKLVFKVEAFKMIPNDYNVSITGKDVAAFESDFIDYYLAIDLNSKF